MNKTKIAWADSSWNPVTGCTQISEGCVNCYAKAVARRYKSEKCFDCDGSGIKQSLSLALRNGNEQYPCANCQGTGRTQDYFKVELHPERLDQPQRKLALKCTKCGGKGVNASGEKCYRCGGKGTVDSQIVFVCSMSDLFHPDVPDAFIDRVFEAVKQARNHTFIVLTKRPKRMTEYMHSYSFSRILQCDANTEYLYLPNLWLGVTAENQARADERIPLLLQTPAAKRFVSIEPMLSKIDLDDIPANLDALPGYHEVDYFSALSGQDNDPQLSKMSGPKMYPTLDWVICGGESGPGARECREEWVQAVYEQCQAATVPFFFKQTGNKFIPDCDGATGDCSGPDGSKACTECYKHGEEYAAWERRREWPR